MIKRVLGQLLFYLMVAVITTVIIFVINESSEWLVNKQAAEQGTYKVTAIFDGDTIEVLMDGKKQKVRLIGVDTPETGGNGTDVECYGKEATDFTRNILEGNRVMLRADSLSTNRDRYDRLLRYVYRKSDSYDVNYELIRQGYSPLYTNFPNDRIDEFTDAHELAIDEGLGLHSACR